MRIALTGGTGFVGQAVLDAAAGRGISVTALTRRAQPARAGVAWVAGDLADGAALIALMAGADAVLHVAGAVSAPDPAAFDRANVAGTEAAMRAAKQAGVRRFIFVSSLAAREPGLSAYGASKAAAEALVAASDLDWTILRPPAVYGPRDHEMFELFRAAKWGVVPVPAGGRASLIHVDDLARLLLDLIPGGGAVSRRRFEPDDATPGGWANADLGHAIAQAVGRPRALVVPVSATMMRLATRADRLLRGKKAKLTPDRARYMVHPDWVASAAAAVPAAVWRATIETRAGLAATTQWYIEQGWF